MDHPSAAVVLFFSLYHWANAELVHGLASRMTWGTGVYLVVLPTILSGSVALLVKYVVAVRILPVYKLLSGSMLALLVSWYIDRICRNSSYLLVRAVGFAIIFGAVAGLVVVTEDGFAGGRVPVGPTVVAAADYGAMGD